MYDLLHRPGTAAELDGLERLRARFVPARVASRPWLEPCCGTGRFLRLIARRGGRCAGVELDPSVAAYANTRLEQAGHARRARALVGDIRKLDRLVFPRGLGPPFAVTFCPHNSLRHLRSAREVVEHLRAVRRVLAPGGVYAVGVGLQDPDEPVAGEDVHRASGRGVKITAVCQYFDAPRGPASGARMERVVTHTTVVRAGSRRMLESVYDLLCLDPGLWARCVRAAGFDEIAVVDDDRASDLPPGRTDYAYRVLRARA